MAEAHTKSTTLNPTLIWSSWSNKFAATDWDILGGVSSLGVAFTRKTLAGYDK